MLESLRRFKEYPAWLEAMTRPDTLRDSFAQAIPEFADGRLTLQAVHLQRARLKGDSYSAMFDLTLSDGAASERTVSVGGALGPPEMMSIDRDAGNVGTEVPLGEPGWRARVPDLGLELWTLPPDEALPALPALSDPVRSRDLLERGIRESSPAYRDIRIRSSVPDVVRYKPGSRCTVVYHLDYDDPDASRGWPELVVAKTYRGAKGRNAYDGMRLLWESDLRSGAVVTIAEPLAFLPDLNVLLQGGMGEDATVKDLLRMALVAGGEEAEERFNAFLAKTAAGLAALHGCGVEYGDLLTWEDELAEVREIVARLAQVVPEIAEAPSAMLGELEQMAAQHPAQPAGPAHRSFRPAQVLTHGQAIGFIDFDGFCRCEPAIDVALFLATMRYIGTGGPLAQGPQETDEASQAERMDLLDGYCEFFLSEYETQSPISRRRVELWEALDLLTYVLHCWTKIRPYRLEGAMQLLERHLDRMELQPASY
jgi:hypothetical protein